MELDEGYRFHVQFHITNQCNLRCKHCYESGKDNVVEWKLEEFKKAIDKLWSCFKKWGVEGEISLIGGEPTMAEDFIPMLEYLSRREDMAAISVLTNGVKISEDILRSLQKANCYVQVSIDGTDEKTHDYIRGKGTYKKTMDNVSMLNEKGLVTSAHYVLSKDTYPLKENFFDELLSKGISRISFSRLVPIGNASKETMLSPRETEETYSFLAKMKKKYEPLGMHIGSTRPLWCNFGHSGKCPVGFQTITITENGDIMPCRRLPIVTGNIKTDSFFKVWYTDAVLCQLRDRTSINKCGNCSMLNECGGGRCIAYAYYGDYMERDPQCWL